MGMPNQYLGKLVSEPVHPSQQRGGGPPRPSTRGWSAEFEDKEGKIVRRYQTSNDDTEGIGHVGFFFNEVACQSGGGKRRKQTKKQKRSKRRRTSKSSKK
jgi:hypothetical protein